MNEKLLSMNKAHWHGQPLAARMSYLGRDMHVSHPDFVRAMKAIKKGVVNCEQLGSGAGLLVLAPTGAGKSYLSRYLKRVWPNVDEEWSTTIPVLDFQIPRIVNKTQMSKAALKATGALLPRANDPYDQLIHLIRKLGTRVIVIDNVHDIPAQRRDGGIFDIGNWIRDLIDHTKVLVVLLGAPSAYSLVSLNPQLRRRTTPRIEVRYFEIETEKGSLRFRKLLEQFDSELPLSQAICWDELLIKQVYWATFGVMDYIRSLFVEAVRIAVERGLETITREIFEAAFSAKLEDALSSGQNPFSKGGPTRALTEPGEPFFNWSDAWQNPVKALPRDRQ